MWKVSSQGSAYMQGVIITNEDETVEIAGVWSEQDAHLAAAAPALLEALKKAVAWMDDRREIAEYVPEIAESLTAISQAEGKE